MSIKSFISVAGIVLLGLSGSVILLNPLLSQFQTNLDKIPKSKIDNPEAASESEPTSDSNKYPTNLKYYHGRFLFKLSDKVFEYLKSKSKIISPNSETLIKGLKSKTTNSKLISTYNAGETFRDLCTEQLRPTSDSNTSPDFTSLPSFRLCFMNKTSSSSDNNLSKGQPTALPEAKDLNFQCGTKSNGDLGKDFYKNKIDSKQDSDLIDLEQEMEEGFKTTKIGTEDSSYTISNFLNPEDKKS